MTDTMATAPAVDPAPSTAPVDTPVGEPTSVDAGVDTAATSTPQAAFDWSPYENELVPIQVDGKEELVPFSEARLGHMRQADYTRKSQAIAAERQRLSHIASLAAALENDPHRVIGALAEAYEWSPQGAVDTTQAAEDVDPLEQRIAPLEQFIAQQEKQAVLQQIEADYQHLESTYGEIDRDAVRDFAVANRVDLITAYQKMTYDDVRQKAAVVEAKRTAQVVHTDGSVAAGSVSKPPAKFDSLREALRHSYRQAMGTT